MIKIIKLPKPQILENNEKKWTQEYQEARKNGTNVSDRYNHEEIKNTLIKETHGKCAYCESKLKHISFADIEHILPKSKRPDLYVEWSNLTISCEICNRTNKKDYYDPSDPLIHPILDNPNEYIIALGAIIYYIPGNRKGEVTISQLDLNRTDLIEQRTQKLNYFRMLADKYVKETNPKIKSILKDQLLEESSNKSEYSLITSSFLKNVLNM